jgi:hypothetical protein
VSPRRRRLARADLDRARSYYDRAPAVGVFVGGALTLIALTVWTLLRGHL